VIRVIDGEGLLCEELRALIGRAAKIALAEEKKEGRIDIATAAKNKIRALNMRHRGINRVTDVLSFPAVLAGRLPPDGFWGDIVICPARATQQARKYGHAFARELTFLTVHGVLHLLGYDHEARADGESMRQRERVILGRLNIPDETCDT
jgi:probable rRNA maturation factor